MRALIVALAALAYATSAGAAGFGIPNGPYKLDANGKCRAANGQITRQDLCRPPPMCEHGKYKLCGQRCIPINQSCHPQQGVL